MTRLARRAVFGIAVVLIGTLVAWSLGTLPNASGDQSAGMASEATPATPPATPRSESTPEPASVDETQEPEPEIISPRPATRASLTDAKETLVASDGLVPCPERFRKGWQLLCLQFAKATKKRIPEETRLPAELWVVIENRWQEWNRNQAAVMDQHRSVVGARIMDKRKREEFEEYPHPKTFTDPAQQREAMRAIREAKKPRVPGEIISMGSGREGYIQIIRTHPSEDARIAPIQSIMQTESDRLLMELGMLIGPFIASRGEDRR